jgi:molybdenum cofactor cytidylyltransferase
MTEYPSKQMLNDDSPLALLVLAGGQSKRMGQNKLLLPVEGKTLLFRTVERVLQAGAGPVLVVTGHEAPRTEFCLAQLAVRCVRNPHYERGLLSSLQAGLLALPDSIQAAMVVLADQVFIDSALIHALAQLSGAQPADVLIAPLFGSLRGHPVIIGRRFFTEVLQHTSEPEKGAHFLFKRHPKAVRLLTLPEGPGSQDLDTPADYEMLQRQLLEIKPETRSRVFESSTTI